MSEESTFVKQKFAEYYQDNIERIQPPESMEKREFGFFIFKEKIMVRHQRFRSEESFKSYLVSSAPSDVYYSSAYYEKPEATMNKKGWLGADLIFDIDSDHLETPCKTKHEFWICKSCEATGIDTKPERCHRCNGSSFKIETWLCDSCLETAKAETLKLVDFLTVDFGFPQGEIEVCFSGQRGYHVRVKKEEVKLLDQAARKEIVDYISGTGLMIELYGWRETRYGRTRELTGPDLSDPNWYGRIARGVYELISSSTLNQLEQLPGIGKTQAKTLVDNRDFILKNWNWKTNWKTIKGINVKLWTQIIQHVINNHRVAAVIDSVVTTDVHRLIRLPLSLHGKTGLMAVDVPVDALERFDPLKEAIAFKSGTLKVYVNEAHQFRIGDEEFGPYTRETVVLPKAAAIYLLCKKVAKPV